MEVNVVAAGEGGAMRTSVAMEGQVKIGCNLVEFAKGARTKWQLAWVGVHEFESSMFIAAGWKQGRRR
jgi:hypothetical protein